MQRSSKWHSVPSQLTLFLSHLRHYKGADKSLARPDWKKKQMEVRHFSSDAEVIAAAEKRMDGQTYELFLSGLQKLGFNRCSLFSSWSR